MASTSTVQLYRYDLTNGMARSMAPMLIGRPLEGVWHTSIVAFGKEFYFDGGVGIVAESHPGRTRFGAPYRTETLGSTNKTETAFVAWCQACRQGTETNSSRIGGHFGPNNYNLLNNNCNHFSQAASQFLLGRDIPADVRNMIPDLLSTPLGQMIRPTLEQMTNGPPGAGMGYSGFPATAASASAASPSSGGRAPVPGFPTNSASSSAAPRSTGTAATDVCRGLLSPRTGLSDSEKEDVDLLKATLESNELIADGDTTTDGFETTLTSLNLLRTVMEKIVAFPTDAKYRALSTSSKTYTTKLKRLEPFGALDVLRIAGFVVRPHPGGTGAEQWYLSDAAGSKPVLQALIDMLDDVIENVETAQAVAMSAQDAGPAPAAEEETATAATSTTRATSAATSTAKVLCYSAAPYPTGFEPLAVGQEGGEPLYATLVTPAQSGESSLCMGKCRLPRKSGANNNTTSTDAISGHICTVSGKEKNVRGALSVLCVRVCDDGDEPCVWVPAPLLRAALKEEQTSASSRSSGGGGGGAVESCIFRGHGRFGVARAAMGAPGAVHPGVYEPSGRCVVPYGGVAHVATNTAQVLCTREAMPASLLSRVQALQVGDALLEAVHADRGNPWSSFAALRGWEAPTEDCVRVPITTASGRGTATSTAAAGEEGSVCLSRVKPCPLRPRHTTSSAASNTQKRLREDAEDENGATPSASTGREDRCHLLVCHDFKGGYLPEDYAHFALEEEQAAAAHAHVQPHKSVKAVEEAYTANYWQLMDVFVYFSHQRVSVPPYEWIEAGHRRGVPVLGTILTEGAGGLSDLKALLSDATIMGETIRKLAELCVTYGFDGYLLNIENALESPSQVKRLQLFTRMLREKLQSLLPHRSGLVYWYDAVTVEGRLTYQNALTPKNKPFMDLCDGLFTNYFWNPMHLALSKAAAAGRERDVYVGVDVFGRNMFGGGQYNTYTAAHEAARSGLSVALFAPSWTAECEGHGSRQTFLRADNRLWAHLQKDFVPHTTTRCVTTPHQGQRSGFWTCFTSGVGATFHVDGRAVCTGRHTTTTTSPCAVTGWCQLSAAHQEPSFEFMAPDDQIQHAAWSREATSSSSASASASSLTAAKAPLQCRLLLVDESGRAQGDAVTASWITETSRVWFGDRALRFLIPPGAAVKLLDVYEPICVESASTEAVTFTVDMAFLEGVENVSSPGAAAHSRSGATTASDSSALPATSRRVRLFYRLGNTTSTTTTTTTTASSSGSSSYRHLDLAEGDAAQCELVSEHPCDTSATAVASLVWRVRRYTWKLTHAALLAKLGLQERASTEPLSLTVRAVALANTCRDRSLLCHLGGVALVTSTPPSPCDGASGSAASPLVLGPAHSLEPTGARLSWCTHPTSTPGVQVVAVPEAAFVPTRNANGTRAGDSASNEGAGAFTEVALFAEMSKTGSGATTTLFMGVHRVPINGQDAGHSSNRTQLVPLHAPMDWLVTGIHYFPYSLPF